MIEVLNACIANSVAYLVHFHIRADEQLLRALDTQVIQICYKRASAFLCKSCTEILLVEADVVCDGLQRELGIVEVVLHKFPRALHIPLLFFAAALREGCPYPAECIAKPYLAVARKLYRQ